VSRNHCQLLLLLMMMMTMMMLASHRPSTELLTDSPEDIDADN